MKKIGPVFVALLIMMAGFMSARAQEAVSAERTALAKELFEATGGKQQFKEVMSTMMASQEEETMRMMNELSKSYKTATPAEKALIAKMTAEAAQRIKTRVQDFFDTKAEFDQFIDEGFVPIYARHFTEDELRDMIAFYHSPTGQKMLKEGAPIAVELIPALSKTFIPALVEFMNHTRDEEITALKQKLPKKKPSRKT